MTNRTEYKLTAPQARALSDIANARWTDILSLGAECRDLWVWDRDGKRLTDLGRQVIAAVQ